MVSKKIRVLYLIALSIFSIYILLLFSNYSEIPETVASHIDITGKVDGYSHKNALWISSIVNLFILVVLGLLIKNPKYANYPVELTDENRENVYKKMQLFLAAIAIITTLFFSYMIFKAIGLEKNYIYLIIYVIAVPIFTIIYFGRSK
ncbi:hypothetical protein HYN56_02775 [Flavobacterium crocinum]|uniref:DUF1648 domain-containing protein n=1 Tax=Flavobacterium crocinum TaxID=2183896 RepID=A0A2S1YGM2_9FLAO|nr:DUF1648 domain-containing protein [Flavobacterium crocinum]AWK03199.1 hypothetical protein HYN56_02775 [Flavobacterium crocinum]